MKDKLKVALVCLLFAVPFGAIGAFASWMIGAMIVDGSRAGEWVKVRATVDAPKAYRYTFDGREYQGTRLGLEPLGGSDNIDGWHEGMAAHFAAAMAEKKPITVYVNPDRPAESVVDREIRWKLVLFMSVFAFAFGGVGVGALFVAIRALIGKADSVVSQATPRRASQESGLGILWIFAFFWNVISFPIALLAIPDAIANGEWVALIVVIFPVIGVLLLWAAIAATIKRIREKFRGEVPSAAGSATAPLPIGRKPANDGVFARGMLSDDHELAAHGAGSSATLIDTGDEGMPDATVQTLEKITGKKLTDEERAQFAKVSRELTVQQRAALAKYAGWVPKIKYVVFAIIGLVIASEVVMPIIRLFIER